MSNHNSKRKSSKKSCKGNCSDSDDCDICKKIYVISSKSNGNTCEKDKLHYKGIFNLGTRYSPCDVVYVQGNCTNLGGSFKYIGTGVSIGVDPRMSSDWQVIALDGQCVNNWLNWPGGSGGGTNGATGATGANGVTGATYDVVHGSRK